VLISLAVVGKKLPIILQDHTREPQIEYENLSIATNLPQWCIESPASKKEERHKFSCMPIHLHLLYNCGIISLKILKFRFTIGSPIVIMTTITATI
jgi:hypothetical protein